MSSLALVHVPLAAGPAAIAPRLAELKQMVLDSVISTSSKRSCAGALDDLFTFAAGRPLTRAMLMEWRTTMDRLSASTVNVRLAAMRKLVSEARRNGIAFRRSRGEPLRHSERAAARKPAG